MLANPFLKFRFDIMFLANKLLTIVQYPRNVLKWSDDSHEVKWLLYR